MQEFVVFAVAASMCVLCFAVGFVAALNVRIAERTVPSPVGGTIHNDVAAPHADATQPTAAASPFVPVPAPVVPGLPIALPQAEPTLGQQSDVATRPVTQPPPLPRRPAAVQPPQFPTPGSPPAKVFLFGDPPVEPVVVPARPPVPAASEPSPWVTPQKAAPYQLPPAQVELLPHRAPYARSGHRR